MLGLSGFFGFIVAVFLFIFAVISILTPIWIYFIHIKAGKALTELQSMNLTLHSMLANQQSPPAATQIATADAIQTTTPATQPKTVAMRTTCPACSFSFSFPGKYAGQIKPCPECKAKITLPL